MLYLVDEPLADVAFRTAADDPDARLVLLQDGVYLDPDLDVPTYAVERDVAVRGASLPAGVESVTYDRLIEMVLEEDVKSFV